MKIRLDQIDLDPKNPKQEDRIKRIAQSFKAIGQIEPVKLRILPEKRYEMVSGHHRYWAAEACKWKAIDAEIEGMSETTRDVHRSVAAAFENREDPDLVKAQKMLKSIGKKAGNQPEDLKRLSDEYGYAPQTIESLLGYARFADKYSPNGGKGQMESLSLGDFKASGPLSDRPEERAAFLLDAAKETWSNSVIASKAKAIAKKLQEAEEAREQEELVIARRREAEAEAVKKVKPTDSTGKVKTPEVTAAEAERAVTTKRHETTNRNDWEASPTAEATLREIIALWKERVPAWRQVFEIGKFNSEARRPIANHIGRAIVALQQLKKELEE